MDRQIEALARQERLEYYRKWRAENREKVKKYNVSYWEKRAQNRLNESGEGNNR